MRQVWKKNCQKPLRLLSTPAVPPATSSSPCAGADRDGRELPCTSTACTAGPCHRADPAQRGAVRSWCSPSAGDPSVGRPRGSTTPQPRPHPVPLSTLRVHGAWSQGTGSVRGRTVTSHPGAQQWARGSRLLHCLRGSPPAACSHRAVCAAGPGCPAAGSGAQRRAVLFAWVSSQGAAHPWPRTSCRSKAADRPSAKQNTSRAREWLVPVLNNENPGTLIK